MIDEETVQDTTTDEEYATEALEAALAVDPAEIEATDETDEDDMEEKDEEEEEEVDLGDTDDEYEE